MGEKDLLTWQLWEWNFKITFSEGLSQHHDMTEGITWWEEQEKVVRGSVNHKSELAAWSILIGTTSIRPYDINFNDESINPIGGREFITFLVSPNTTVPWGWGLKFQYEFAYG